jgi:hypothetical protein
MIVAFKGRLPGGFVDESGRLHREFELAALTGQDEELLAQARRRESASLVTKLISRCVSRLGDIQPVSDAIARQLLVGDRQYLLLKLRQMTFGDRVHADLFCPWPECGKRVSIDFGIGDVPVEESVDKGPHYQMVLSSAAAGTEEPGDREICFRLPNGSDQEFVSPLLAENEARALTLLLMRCVQRVGPSARISEKQIESLSPLARKEIEAEMARLAPKVELDMEMSCPECGHLFDAPFDLQSFFFGELRARSDFLYREVHYLAYHYHWSEREIMEMTVEKRRKYIDVLADEIEKLNNSD